MTRLLFNGKKSPFILSILAQKNNTSHKYRLNPKPSKLLGLVFRVLNKILLKCHAWFDLGLCKLGTRNRGRGGGFSGRHVIYVRAPNDII